MHQNPPATHLNPPELPELKPVGEVQQAGGTVSDPHGQDSEASFMLVDARTLLKTLDLTQESC